jgi:hypothetical protein
MFFNCLFVKMSFYFSSSSSRRCNWQSQWVCWQDTLWQPMWLIAAQPASKINACFKTVDWRRLNYFARQSVSQIRRSIKEKIFSVLLPWNFFEVLLYNILKHKYIVKKFKYEINEKYWNSFLQWGWKKFFHSKNFLNEPPCKSWTEALEFFKF